MNKSPKRNNGASLRLELGARPLKKLAGKQCKLRFQFENAVIFSVEGIR